jgi:hypothetical protein
MEYEINKNKEAKYSRENKKPQRIMVEEIRKKLTGG